MLCSLIIVYSILVQCFVFYWVFINFTVLLNFCHDLVLVLEQFGIIHFLFENCYCSYFNLIE